MVKTPKSSKQKPSQIISKVISPALRLWLRSQVEEVATLQLNIVGCDRQILTGYIPQVALAANQAVYQGLHLSQIQLEGSNIRLNLGQIIKRKPVRLLEPVPVVGQLLLLEPDLQSSLEAPLLSNALTELLYTFLKSDDIIQPGNDPKQPQIRWEKININIGQLTLRGIYTNHDVGTKLIVIRAGIQLATPNQLELNPLQVQIDPDAPPLSLDGFVINLGPEVELQELTLTTGQLICRGGLKVMP
ncbi:hypothetical protein BJP34_25860 [Moorena producens PAL-8-15-08-1]|uniref:DUF2993 domain-containing protein n=1 Tax=Moorena producens PAL-8-15-08-1 TaxID=1458985 RepID=A0A1D8TXL7_9CYAN|nr:DUF2993 domain-containing protein [Moorena producens]AOX02411.1 hypothetical protein BJP34_25860 [Moorena producens PAL-8-15-08-1]